MPEAAPHSLWLLGDSVVTAAATGRGLGVSCSPPPLNQPLSHLQAAVGGEGSDQSPHCPGSSGWFPDPSWDGGTGYPVGSV